VQDNGTGPDEKKLIDFQCSRVRFGDLQGTRQKELSKGPAEAGKTAERVSCDGKNGI
jgi:hypothetical protein